MDRVMRQVPGNWLGRAGHSSVGYSLCPNPHPIVVLHGVGVVIFHSFDLDSSVPLESLTYFSVWRTGGMEGYLGPLIWLGFENPRKQRVLDMLCLGSHPGAVV